MVQVEGTCLDPEIAGNCAYLNGREGSARAWPQKLERGRARFQGKFPAAVVLGRSTTTPTDSKRGVRQMGRRW
jgi:hypothetical protein